LKTKIVEHVRRKHAVPTTTDTIWNYVRGAIRGEEKATIHKIGESAPAPEESETPEIPEEPETPESEEPEKEPEPEEEPEPEPEPVQASRRGRSKAPAPKIKTPVKRVRRRAGVS
jgi:outer membrane biosynthesis protein TonB